MTEISLQLADPLLAGNGPLGDYTTVLAPTWRRSIARHGGFKIGSCTLTGEQLTRAELDEWFRFGLLREIRETGGGAETWRGCAAKLEYVRGNDTFVRDVSMMANAVRSIYTRIGDNVLANGSAESGAWTVYNGATVTQSREWVSHGTYSCKIVVADTQIRGATVQDGISVTAGVQYLIRITLHALGGSWRFAANRSDNGHSLAHYSTHGVTGDHVVEITIPETNTYTGTVSLIITSEASAGTIYGDAGVFQSGPVRAETGWYLDQPSVRVHGRKEDILLRGGKSMADANAEAQGELLARAWPNPQPPRSGSTVPSTSGDSLQITFAGYYATLNWLYATLAGTRSCSNWVKALSAAQAAYVIPSAIETNDTDYYVDDRAPLRIGDILRDIVDAGETGGAKWGIGVYAGRRLIYGRVAPELSYYRRGGRLYSSSGAEIEPWLAQPGWALWEDMPLGPGTLTGSAQHDPRWVYLEEVELTPGGLEFSLDER